MALGGAEPEETTMLRKFSLVAVAAASLAAAALAPTAASAFGGHGGWHGGGWHGGGWGWGGPRFFVGGPAYYGTNYGYGGCYVRQLVPTPWGPRWRLVNRCY
jgi:opacity protein-like surface antigen